MKTLILVIALMFAGFANAQPKPKTFFVEELTAQQFKDYKEAKKLLDEAKVALSSVTSSIMAKYGDSRLGNTYTSYTVDPYKPYSYKQVEIKEDYAIVTKTTCTPSTVNGFLADCEDDIVIKELSTASKRSLECVQEELNKAKVHFDLVESTIKQAHGEALHYSNGMIQLAVCWYGETIVEIKGKYALITIDPTKSNCGGNGVIIGTPTWTYQNTILYNGTGTTTKIQ